MLKGGVKYEISQNASSWSSSFLSSLPRQQRRHKIMICRFPVQLTVDIHGKKGSIYVPCGKCAWCLRQKRNEWFVRFLEESKKHDFVRFLTLDYDDDHLPVKTDETTGEIIPVVSLRDIQLYHKRIRKAGYKFRFFVASEYGSKGGRPHCHGIYWSDEKIPYYDFWENGDEGECHGVKQPG